VRRLAAVVALTIAACGGKDRNPVVPDPTAPVIEPTPPPPVIAPPTPTPQPTRTPQCPDLPLRE